MSRVAVPVKSMAWTIVQRSGLCAQQSSMKSITNNTNSMRKFLKMDKLRDLDQQCRKKGMSEDEIISILAEKAGKDLAIIIWKKHIKVFKSFDLVCQNGHSLEDETRSVALFSALVTLECMPITAINEILPMMKAKEYLKSSKHYSEKNKDSDH